MSALHRVLGRRLRALRLANGVQQEQIAAAARAQGLRWTRSTVTAIERGGRQIFVGELVLLPDIFAAVGINEIRTPADLLHQVGVNAWRKQFSRVQRSRKEERDEAEWKRWYLRIIGPFPTSPDPIPIWPRSGPAWDIAQEDAILKAAPGLGVPPIALAVAALKKWGHGIAQQREIHLPAIEAVDATLQDPTVPEDEKQRRRRALRGHVTRQLLKQLAPLIAGKPKTRSRKGGRRR